MKESAEKRDMSRLFRLLNEFFLIPGFEVGRTKNEGNPQRGGDDN